MKHPLPAALLAAGFLLVLASPALRLRLGQADFTSFPDSIDSVQALNILNEKFPTGSTLSLDIVVTNANDPATKAAIETMNTKVLAIPGVTGPPTVTRRRTAMSRSSPTRSRADRTTSRTARSSARPAATWCRPSSAGCPASRPS